jgi:cyclopropane fatty-acyl-phospholipid synthase-like methyltransferase
MTPCDNFHNDWYQNLNAKRMEHLWSLGLPFAGRSVLDLGGGTGDLAEYLMSRNGCRLCMLEGRPENVAAAKTRFAASKYFMGAHVHDLSKANELPTDRLYDITFCYGLLYHLPSEALLPLFGYCNRVGRGFSIFCTQVCPDNDCKIIPVTDPNLPTQSISGQGCLPTRQWMRNYLASVFCHVYIPKTQPHHEDFPTDWTVRPTRTARAIFIASQAPIENPKLTHLLIDKHESW